MELSRGKILKSNKTSEENPLAYHHSYGTSAASTTLNTAASAANPSNNQSSATNNSLYQTFSTNTRDNNSSPSYYAQNLQPSLSSSYDPSKWLKSSNEASSINSAVNAGFYSAPTQTYLSNPAVTYSEPMMPRQQMNAISTEELMSLSGNHPQAFELAKYNKQSNSINKHDEDFTGVNRLSKDNIIEKPNSLVADTPPYGKLKVLWIYEPYSL
jgi:hypothetical protein